MNSPIDEPEKPLSPVLSSNKKNKAFFKRKNVSKSRLKLSNRFQEEKLEFETLSLTQNESFWEKIDGIERGFSFKVPVSPAPSVKKSKVGFQTGNGKSIHVSEMQLKSHSQLFDDILDVRADNKPKKFNFLRKSDSCQLEMSNCDISDTQLVLAVDKICDFELEKEVFLGFDHQECMKNVESVRKFKDIVENYAKLKNNAKNTASGGKILITNKMMENAQKLFNNLEDDENSLKKKLPITGFSTASGCKIKISAKQLEKAQNLFANLDSDEDCMPKNNQKHQNKENLPISGFSTASGSKISISAKEMEKAQKLFSSLDNDENFVHKDNKTPQKQQNKENLPIAGFSTASGSKISISAKEMQKAQKLFSNLDEIETPKKSNSSDLESPSTSMTPNRNHFSRTLSDSSLNNTVLSFKTPRKSTSPPNFNSSKRKRSLGVPSCKQIEIEDKKLTKAKLLFDEPPSKKSKVAVTSTPLPNTDLQRVKAIFGDEDFSDIFGQNQNHTVNSPQFSRISINETLIHNPGLIIKDPQPIDLNKWYNDLQQEKQQLEQRLKALSDKENALNQIRNCENIDRRKRPGILWTKKNRRQHTDLRKFVKFKRPGVEANPVRDHFLFSINPQNAVSVHFCASNVETTTDGAPLIPNDQDLIGLTEIELGFMAMPGIEPRLIPKGWLKNHYKWIVWKLASYERMFPIEFKGALTVGNIVEQLKYRYDREIDRAERSALRKIYEKDDAAQKRMVLCVSKVSEELELTDGWYSIRTVIDEPLSFQVFKGNIRVGTKLVIFGAEVYNCDGCYPLEATDLVHMRINYNCTRRAIWHAKLGFQSNPGPFPLQIQHIHPSGGIIGCLRVYIARVYPEKVMERENAVTVWRNKKAEDRRAQEWEVQRNKLMESIHNSVQKEFEDLDKNKLGGKVRYSKKDIEGMTCPQTLLEIFESSIDPDGLQELLTSSQRRCLTDYKDMRNLERQDEIKQQIKQRLGKINVMKRDVSAVLKLLVLDVKGDLIPHTFSVWRPTPSLMQLLKEGNVLTVYNVLPGRAGELNSAYKTKYNLNPDHDCANFQKFTRKYVSITSILEKNFKPCFNEFDTIGLVLNLNIDLNFQFIWLVDCHENFLLVRIYESQKNCILLDGVKRGQVITVCNLTHQAPDGGIGQAVGGLLTIFAKYPQHKHLQEALKDFEGEIPQNLEEYLENCDNKIKYYQPNPIAKANRSSVCQTSSLLDETTLDTAMSMLDIDKLLNN